MTFSRPAADHRWGTGHLLVWSKWPGVGRFANAGFCLLNCRFARCATLWCGSPPDIARVRASTLASAWYPPRRARVWFWIPYHKRICGQLLGSLVTRGTFGRFGADIDFVRRVAADGTDDRNDLENGSKRSGSNRRPRVLPPQRRLIRRRTADMGDERTRNRATRYASSDCSAAPQRAVRLVEIHEAWAGAARCPAG